ncbi:ATP-binding protein [Pseudoalteromonas rubra]|uniref:Uncharacterized protein n=1 Tax=Pseudoalteromonas rubra TaxID=43658 RepID=A0A0F4QFQ8_9GAMM|nr:ATP-binding protein [Pseudoalteromonas rubra]KJZ06095.1 hypothetical protein TW77_20480 [Pseudoalteromonas rubra]
MRGESSGSSQKEEVTHQFPSFLFPIHEDSEFPKTISRFFVGRSSLRIDLLGALEQSEELGACYLVGGYRGVGKSQLVEKVLADYKSKVESHAGPVEHKDHNNTECKVEEAAGNSNEDEQDKAKSKLKEVVFATRQFISNIPKISIKIYNNHFKQFYTDVLSDHKRVIKLNVNLSDSKVLHFRGVMMDCISLMYDRVLSEQSYCARFSTRFMAVNFWQKVTSLILFLLCIPSILLFRVPNIASRINWFSKCKNLLMQADYEQELEMSSSLKSGMSNVANKAKYKRRRLSDRQVENKMLELLKIEKKRSTFVFVFDELDKLGDKNTEQPEGTKRDLIEDFLGRMKSILTCGYCRFIFIGDREIVDNYHSESGSKNALYEGVFDQIFYVPSLLSDYSDRRPNVLHSMVFEYTMNVLFGSKNMEGFYDKAGFSKPNHDTVISRSDEIQNKYIRWVFGWEEQGGKKKEIEGDDLIVYKNYQFILNRFIRFLTIHSWGNYRRLTVLLHQFLEQSTKENYKRHNKQSSVQHPKLNIENGRLKYLHLDKKEISRILLAANAYEMVSWEMEAKLGGNDDKLLISTINSVVDLFKFHELPFSGSYLDRTYEGIDIHAEPHLKNAIKDVIEHVNYSFIRKVRRGLFEYRFFNHHEEEIKYISKSVGAKASNYTFGLSSYDKVIQIYEAQRQWLDRSGIETSLQARADVDVILGDINTWERSYDKASSHYSNAEHLLKKVLREPKGETWRHDGGPSFSSHYMLIRVLLKKGLISEVRRNYMLAWRYYREALNVSCQSLGMPYRSTELKVIFKKLFKDGDIRHREVLVLSMLSLNSLSLKTNQTPRIEMEEVKRSLTWSNVNVGQGKYNGSLYLKSVDPDVIYQTLLVHYYSNNFVGVRDGVGEFVKKLIEENNGFSNCKKIEGIDFTTCLILLTWLQSNFIIKINDIVGEYVDGLTQRKGDYHDKNDWKEEFSERWDSYIEKIYSIIFPQCSEELIDGSVSFSDFLYKQSVCYQDLDSSKDSSVEGCFSMFSYVKMYYLIAESLIERGFKVRASYVYLNFIVTYIGVMEILPWNGCSERINKLKDEYKKKYRFYDWLTEIFKLHAKATQVHDEGLYHHQRDMWEEKSEPKDGFAQKLQNRINSKQLTAWHQSHAKNTNIIMNLWYAQALGKLTGVHQEEAGTAHLRQGKEEGSTDTYACWDTSDISDRIRTLNNCIDSIEVDRVLPQYQKNLALLYWLKGRRNLHLHLSKDNKYTELPVSLLDSIQYLYMAIEKSEQLIGCGSIDSWPPRSLVLHNLLEALCESAKFYNCIVAKAKELVSNNLSDELSNCGGMGIGSFEGYIEKQKEYFASQDNANPYELIINDMQLDILNQVRSDFFITEVGSGSANKERITQFIHNTNIKKIRFKLIKSLETMLNARVPRNFLDIRSVNILLKNTSRDLESITTRYSSFYHQLLQGKYFLYDDFKDPQFKIEWMFLHIIKNSGKINREKAYGFNVKGNDGQELSEYFS